MLSRRGWSLFAVAALMAISVGVGVAWLLRPAATSPQAGPKPGSSVSPGPTTSSGPAQPVSSLPVPGARPGVPVPTRGLYWGGTNNHDSPSVPGCAVPANSGVTGGYDLLECKIRWAAGQLKLATPTVAGATGGFHTTMARAYLEESYGCRDQQDRLKPGGDIYRLASAPGRRVLMLSTRCGPWKNLAGGGGRAAEDTYLRQVVRLLDKLPVPTILVFHHEPEDEACAPASGMGTPDDFRRAYRQFAADVRTEDGVDGRRSISTGWILQNATFLDGQRGDHVPFTGCTAQTGVNTSKDNPLRNPENWYPGDDAVDWIASDAYTHGTDKSLLSAIKPFVRWAGAPCPTTHPSRDWSCTAARARRPLALGEFGPGLGKAVATQAEKAAWLDRIRADLNNPAVHEFDRLKAMAYWSSGAQNVIDMPADPSHPALRAYTRLTLDPKIARPVLPPAAG